MTRPAGSRPSLWTGWGAPTDAGRPLRVLVIDDSAVVRQVMSLVLPKGGGIEVTVAADPIIAERKIGEARPDVIVLDLEMPRMDGLTFLRRQMERDPIPVVVCSSLGQRGSESALRAIEEGAIEVVAKPQLGVKDFLHDSATMLIDAVRAAARARPRRPGRAVPARVGPDAMLPPPRATGLARTTDRVVAVAASTGGTEALREMLEAMPPGAPGLAIVQHMPAGFTAAFANRLNSLCRIDVKEAEDGDRILEGRALIAPGNRHLMVRRDGAHYAVRVADGPLVSRHRPSADVLFRSVAQAAGANAVGVILTGMGDDGAEGLLEMKRAGAPTLAQDEATCVVFGMPKEAIARGAVDDVLPLESLAGAVLRRAVGLRAG